MGQEILYCNACGKKLLGDDFTRGRAHTFNNRQYCSGCLPQSISGPRPVPVEPAKPAAPAARMRPSTHRALPAAAPRPMNPVALVAVGFVVALAGVAYVVATSKTEEPAPVPPVAPARPPVVAAPPRKVDPPPPPAPPAVSKEKIAQELQALDAKVQPTIKNEQFAAVIDLLEEARKRYDVPEWEREVSKRIKDVREMATALFGPLKEQALTAQVRGAVAEAQQLKSRVALWGRKDLVDDLDQALGAVIPSEPLPPGAVVQVRFPIPEGARYRLAAEQKNGAAVGRPGFGGMMIGFESGLEILKIPSEGEVRVVFTTTSDKMVTVVLRAFDPDGKNHPYNFWFENPAPGRPQVIKFPITQLKDWNKVPITVGSVVDNIYFRQDDPAAVLTLHQFVIFKTKD